MKIAHERSSTKMLHTGVMNRRNSEIWHVVFIFLGEKKSKQQKTKPKQTEQVCSLLRIPQEAVSLISYSEIFSVISNSSNIPGQRRTKAGN